MTDRGDFQKAVEAADLEGMVACLADDVVLHSPVTFKPFEGKAAVEILFNALLQVFEEFRYVDQFENEQSKVLRFEAKVATRIVDGIDMLHFNGDGLIDDFTVMVRPLSAALALADNVGAKLGYQGG